MSLSCKFYNRRFLIVVGRISARVLFPLPNSDNNNRAELTQKSSHSHTRDHSHHVQAKRFGRDDHPKGLPPKSFSLHLFLSLARSLSLYQPTPVGIHTWGDTHTQRMPDKTQNVRSCCAPVAMLYKKQKRRRMLDGGLVGRSMMQIGTKKMHTKKRTSQRK